MKISKVNAHPAGKGRLSRGIPYRIVSVGARGPSLPEQIDTVSLILSADDGTDLGTSTRLYSALSLVGNSPDSLDNINHLIHRLIQMRDCYLRNQAKVISNTTPCTCDHALEEHGHDPDHPSSDLEG